MREIIFNNETLILSVLESNPLLDEQSNVVDYTNHRTTLTPNEDERAKAIGGDVEEAFNRYMTDEVKAAYAAKQETQSE